MKIRNGFISNSSSTSFVLDIKEMPDDLKKKIFRMTGRTNDCSRCTGIITSISEWASQFEDGEYDDLAKSYSRKDVVMVRESDEDMGGSFSDYGFCAVDLKPYILYEFEYH